MTTETGGDFLDAVPARDGPASSPTCSGAARSRSTSSVFAPDDPGQPRRVLSLGEARWDKMMNAEHPERLRRARDLVAVKGYDVSATKLACYSGAGFDPELVDLASDDPAILLVGLEMLYA